MSELNPFTAKSIFLPWPLSVLGGDGKQIAAKLREAGFEAVWLHREDIWSLARDLTQPLVDALHAAGLAVAGSTAIYGSLPVAEGQIAGDLVRRLGLDGMVFDAEVGFDAKTNANSNAIKTLAAYRAAAGETPVSWCYWSFPSLHTLDVARAAMTLADYATPMCYWSTAPYYPTAFKPAEYLRRSLAEWLRWTDSSRIIPIGRAYNGDKGLASSADIRDFFAEAQAQGLRGVSWWDMYHAMTLPEIWQTLAALPPFRIAPEPEPPSLPFKVYLPLISSGDVPASAAEAEPGEN